MSHKKLREQKDCLNCGHQVEELYCTHCGQENLEIHDSVWSLIAHYIQDLFHYDNRLWHTLKYLVLRPGRVAREYMDGKRKQNLEPIRFYVFASSVFFLLLFFTVGSSSLAISDTAQNNYSKRLYHLKQEKEYRKGTADTAIVNLLTQSLKEKMEIQDSVRIDSSNQDSIGINTSGRDSIGIDTSNQGVEIDLFGPTPLDTMEAEGWLDRVLLKRLEARQEELEKEHEGDKVEAFTAILNEMFHALPQLFFLSLPFFAFFLKILYFRRPKNSYVEHFIFSIYFYSYLFVIMIMFLGAEWINERSAEVFVESGMSYATTALALYPFYYLFVSMKRFYSDRWIRLTFRYLILLFLLLIILILLFLAIAIVTFLW